MLLDLCHPAQNAAMLHTIPNLSQVCSGNTCWSMKYTAGQRLQHDTWSIWFTSVVVLGASGCIMWVVMLSMSMSENCMQLISNLIVESHLFEATDIASASPHYCMHTYLDDLDRISQTSCWPHSGNRLQLYSSRTTHRSISIFVALVQQVSMTLFHLADLTHLRTHIYM